MAVGGSDWTLCLHAAVRAVRSRQVIANCAVLVLRAALHVANVADPDDAQPSLVLPGWRLAHRHRRDAS